MRTTRTLVETSHFAVRAVTCLEDDAGWSAPEAASGTRVILVQRGRFRLRTNGRRTTADPTTGYLQRPGDELSFAHPAGGDVCTSVILSGDPTTARTGDPAPSTVRVDARLELAHRILLRTGSDPDFAAAEAVMNLLQLAIRRAPDESPAPGRYDLADRAREAILADDEHSGGLVALAELLQTSPSHLSRTFRHHTGMSVSRYRNRVRISRALERIGAGETDLAVLAHTLGFSDQAHLTRTMRREVGHTPGHVRALLPQGQREGPEAT